MFNQFVSKLNPKQQVLFFIVVILVTIVLFERLLVAPSLSRVKQLDESIEKQEEVIRENLAFLQNKKDVEKEIDVFKEFYTKDTRVEEEVIAEFLKQLEFLGIQSNVQLSKITPAGQEYQKEYLKYFLTVDCSGTLEKITNFIYTINNSKDLLKVEKMSLASSRSGDEVKTNLTISKMIIGADPSTNAKNLVKIKENSSKEE